MSSISICSIGGNGGKKPNRKIPNAGKPSKHDQITIKQIVIYQNIQMIKKAILEDGAPFTLDDLEKKKEECIRINEERLRNEAKSRLYHLFEDGSIPEEEIDRLMSIIPYYDRPQQMVIELKKIFLSNGKIYYQLEVCYPSV